MERLQVILELITGQYKREAREAATATDTIGKRAKDTGVETGRMSGHLDSARSSMNLLKGAAAVLIATKVVGFFKDAAQAAAEDEKSQRLLALALENTSGATDAQVDSTEAWIDAMARTRGIADDQLRPALAELARATGSTKEAQDQLAVALDISTAKGLSLESVTVAMGKAQLGNVGALGRLGIATRDAEGKMLTFDQVLQNASNTMGGAALEAATTLEGQLARLEIAWEEQKEGLGGTFIPLLSRGASTLSFFISGMAGPTQHAIDGFMTRLSDLTQRGIDPMADRLRSATAILTDTNKKAEITAESVEVLTGMFNLTAPELQTMSRYLEENAERLGIADSELKEMTSSLNVNAQALIDQGRGLGVNRGAVVDAVEAEEDLVEEVDKATSALQRFEDEVRSQTDPLYALRDASQTVADTKAEINRLQDEGKAGTPEWITAVADLAQANDDLTAAQLRVGDQSTITKDEYRLSLEAMGNLTKPQIDALIAEFERLNAFNFQEHLITIRGRVIGFGLPRVLPTAHEGGVVPGRWGEERLILAQAGEKIIPLNQSPMTRGGDSNTITRWGDTIFHVAGDLHPEAVRTANVLAGIQRRIETRRR